jgi:hypothetical protein
VHLGGGWQRRLRAGLLAVVVTASTLAVVAVSPPPAGAAPAAEPGTAQRLGPNNSALTSMAAAGDDVHVVYQDRTVRPGGMSTVVLRRSEDGGRTFAGRQVISSLTGGDSLTPVVAAAGDDVHVAWKATTSKDSPSLGNAEIFVSTSRDRGKTFDPPVLLDADTADSMNPVVVTDGTTVHVAWSDLQGRVRLARSGDHGASWTPAADLGRGYGAVVSIAQDDAHVAVAWAAGGAVRVVDSTDRGASFGTARDLGTNGYQPKVAVIGVTTVVAWGDWATDTVHTVEGVAGVYGAPTALPPSGQSWVSSLVADDRGHLLLTAQPDTSPEQGVSVWSSTDFGGSWTLSAVRPEATGAAAAVHRAEVEQPEARLTYTAAERFRDHDGDGILDERQSPADVHPSAFTVELDGCRSTGAGQAITAYHWTVEGDTVTTDTCTYDHVFAGQGAYPVDLEIELADGTTTSVVQTVVVRDLVVVSIGDSVGSGEGNPDIPETDDTDPVWQDSRCHRTASAGSALAARQLEVADPQTSVTFIHLACSGASVQGDDLAHGGLLTPYEGIEPESPALDPQVHALAQLLRTAPGERRPIDALFISIGANDVHFSDVVKSCLEPSVRLRGCHEDDTGDELRQRLATLPARYAELAAALDAEGMIDPDRIFITEYFDPTTDEHGAWNMDCVADQWSILPAFINASEARWASEEVVRPLNAKVAAGAAAHGWNLVSGIADAFRGHGYCSSDSWVVGLEESYASQDNKEGSFHPNRAGHQVYGRLLAASASAKLADLEPAPSDPLARNGVGDAYVVVAEGSALHVTPFASTAGGFAARPSYAVTGETGEHAAALAAAATPSGAAVSWTALTNPDGGGSTGDYGVFAAGPGEVANIGLRSVQLVQAPSGSSILVGGKSTTVRARIANDFATDKVVMAKITFSAVDAGVPVDRVVDVAVRVPPGVHDIGLPPDGPLIVDPDLSAFTVEVELDPGNVITEVFEDDNVRGAEGVVVPSPKLRVLYVPVGSAGAVPGCPVVDGLAASARPFLAAVLPVADDKLLQRSSCEAGVEAEPTPAGVVRALVDLGALARTAGYDEAIGVTAPGWLQGAVGAPMVGAALDGSDVPTAGVLVESGEAGDVVAHEIAHTFGLGHAAGVEAPGWWPARNTEQRDTIDLRDPFVQERPWISAATYEGLHAAFSRTLPDPDLIVVRGSIDRDGNVDAPPWVRDVGLLDVELGDTGELALEYRDAGGSLLGSTGFDATPAGELPDAGVAEGFAVRAPVVDGMARLVLKRGSTVLVDRAVTANTPTVEVAQPPAGSYTVGGTIPLTWTATDADGDGLTYTVLVSDDAGATWTPIATDLTEPALDVHASRHVQSSTVRFRVLATDGVNTGSDETDDDLAVVAPSANGRLAFELDRPFDGPSGQDLYSVQPDGTDLAREHTATPYEHENPAYSRDGSMIAYTRRAQLYVFDPETGSERLVYQAPGGTGIDQYPRCPRFSPDGSRLLLRRGAELVTLATDGSGDLTTVVGGGVSCGDWHPSADRISYVKKTTHPGSTYQYNEIRVTDVDGSNDEAITDVRLLVEFPEFDQWLPKWSPAGDEIVLVQKTSYSSPPVPPGFGSCASPQHLCAVAADGSTARSLLTPSEVGWSWPPDSPSWSGDGGAIAIAYHPNGLYVKDLDTGVVTRPYVAADNDGRRVYEMDWQWLPGEPPAPTPPDAEAGGPYAVDQGQPLHLDASATRRRAGEAPSFAWDVDGDGAFDDAAGINPTVTLGEPGPTTIALRVTDPDGTTATDEATVTVANVAPALTAPAALAGAAGRPVTLTATFTDPAATPRTATVDWGDGRSSPATIDEATGSGTVTATHTYDTAGPFTATVRVCEGATCGTAQLAVDISDDARPHITDISPASGPAAGGTEVVLFGDRLSDVTEVRFGGAVAGGLEVLGEHAVRVIAPAGAPGAVDVVATGPAGAGDAAPFTYTDTAPPTAAPVSASSRRHSPVIVALAGDSAAGRPLTYEVVTDPEHGAAAIVDGAVLYTPAGDTFDGTDTFTYRALDDRGGVSPAAPVDVLVGNRAPAAGPPVAATADAGVEERIAKAAALAGATDPDGDALTVLQAYERPDTRGFVTIDGTDLVFVPDADAAGLVAFDVLLGDPYGGTTMATVEVDVEPAPEAPAPETPTPTTDPAPPADGDAPAPAPPGPGYRMAARDGGVFTFGSAAFHGSAVPFRPNAATVGIANGGRDGYWLAGADGGVFSFGDAPYLGSLGGLRLNAPIVAIASTPSGQGYWLAASDGGVFAFGDAPFAGSVAHLRLNAPIVGITASPSGQGYLLVGADGGVFAFGDAAFLGSAAGTDLAGGRVVAILSDRRGYRIVTDRGRVVSFGTGDLGDVDHLDLGGPIVGAARSLGGFLLIGRDGGAFTLGAQRFAGSLPGSIPTQGVVGGAVTAG